MALAIWWLFDMYRQALALCSNMEGGVHNLSTRTLHPGHLKFEKRLLAVALETKGYLY